MENSWNETLIFELDYKKPAFFFFFKKRFYSKALQDILMLSIGYYCKSSFLSGLALMFLDVLLFFA